MACAKDGTQAAIGIHLKSTLLSFCPVFCFVFVLFCLFGCFLCVLLFVVFVSFAFLLVCARSRQLDSFMDYVKVHTSSLLLAFHAYQFNFRQVKACVTTWRKPRRRWTEKKERDVPGTMKHAQHLIVVPNDMLAVAVNSLSKHAFSLRRPAKNICRTLQVLPECLRLSKVPAVHCNSKKYGSAWRSRISATLPTSGPADYR